ncbi:MAG: flagellar hook-length control protein FliK [Gammaproteobacteria bacterium]|jgi:flagellar hook-length control protein FliK
MTQAMAPALPVSLGAGNAPGIAKKSEPQEGFSDTFRAQIEGKPQDPPSDEKATSNAQPVQDQAGDENEVSGEVSANTLGAEAKNEKVQPLTILQNEVLAEPLVQQPLLVGLTVPNAVVEQALAVADTPPIGVAVANVVLPTQSAQLLRGAAGESAGTVIPARVARGKAEQPIVLSSSVAVQGAAKAGQPIVLSSSVAVQGAAKAGQPIVLSSSVAVQGAAKAELLDAGPGPDTGKLMHSVARIPELATPAPVPALLAATPAAVQGGFQAPSSLALPLAVDTPLSNPNWGNVMSARLVWGATQGMQTASIEINPRELGPISVNLRVAGDEASITFVSQHALVREAVEAALPRLRELFSGDGINLGDVDISSGEGRSGHGDDTASADDTSSPGDDDAQADPSLVGSSHEIHPHRLDSLVDTFA